MPKKKGFGGRKIIRTEINSKRLGTATKLTERIACNCTEIIVTARTTELIVQGLSGG